MISENNKAKLYTAVSIAVFAVVFLSALVIGRYSITIQDVVDFLTGDLPHSSNQYKVIVDFTPDENAVFGMSVIVTTAE